MHPVNRHRFRQTAEERYLTDEWYVFLKEYRSAVESAENPVALYGMQLEERERALALAEETGSYSNDEKRLQRRLLGMLRENCPSTEESVETAENNITAQACFTSASAGFQEQKEKLAQLETETAQALEFAFDFMEQAFENGQEMVVFVTELTINSESALFLSEHACERYKQYNEQLLVGTRKTELLSELARDEM